MLHWTIWDREPGVHEASLRRYGSKLVYHITVYNLFTLVTVTCKYSTLTQLTYHFASYNSCSNWRPPTSMQTWHQRTRFCRTLTNIAVCFEWLASRTPGFQPQIVQWNIPYGVRETSYSNHTLDICQGAAESCTPMPCLHWGWWPSIWATVVRCKMVR